MTTAAHAICFRFVFRINKSVQIVRLCKEKDKSGSNHRRTAYEEDEWSFFYPLRIYVLRRNGLTALVYKYVHGLGRAFAVAFKSLLTEVQNPFSDKHQSPAKLDLRDAGSMECYATRRKRTKQKSKLFVYATLKGKKSPSCIALLNAIYSKLHDSIHGMQIQFFSKIEKPLIYKIFLWFELNYSDWGFIWTESHMSSSTWLEHNHRPPYHHLNRNRTCNPSKDEE